MRGVGIDLFLKYLLEKKLAFFLFLGIAFFSLRGIISQPGVMGLESEWWIPPFSEQIRQQVQWDFYSWKPQNDFGAPGQSIGLYYNLIFLYFPSLLGIDGDVISKIGVIIVITIAGYSMFELSRRMGFNVFSSALAGIFYMNTGIVLEKIYIGHTVFVFGYGLIPLILVHYMNIIEKERLRPQSLIVLSIFVTLAYSIMVNLVLIPLLLLLFCTVHSFHQRFRPSFLLGLKTLVITCIIIPFFTHNFWILPLLYELPLMGQLSSLLVMPLTVLPRSLGINLIDTFRFVGTQKVMLIVAGNWNLWSIFSFLPLMLASFALLLRSKDERIIYSAILLILGFTMASASLGPLENLWDILLEKILVLRIFRNPMYWLYLSSLGCALLLGASCDIFQRYLKKFFNEEPLIIYYKHFKHQARVGASTILVCLFVLSIISGYGWPSLTGDLGGKMPVFEFDGKYEELWYWLNNNPDDFRILFLPAPPPITYDGQKDGLFYPGGIDLMSIGMRKPVLQYANYYGPQFTRFILKAMYENRLSSLGELLGLANVKYIVLDPNKRTSTTDNIPYPEMRFTASKLITTLEQQEDIVHSNSIDSIKIFENKNYLSHIYPVSGIGLYAGNLDGLDYLSRLQNFSLKDIGLVFVNQLTSEGILDLTSHSSTVIIVQEGHLPELVLSLVPINYRVDPSIYVSGRSPNDGWSQFVWFWYKWDYQTPLEPLVFTFKSSTLTIPFTTEHDEQHYIYLKVYVGPEASKIELYSDEQKISDVLTKTSGETGFKWVELGPVKIDSGNHNLSIKSLEGENAIASIAIVPERVLKESLETINSIIETTKMFVISEKTYIVNEILYDDDESFWGTADFGTGNIATKITEETGIVNEGSSSLRINVSSGSNALWAVRHSYGLNQNWSNFEAITIYWYGTNSSNSVRIRIHTSDGQHYFFSDFTDNSSGWTQITKSFEEFARIGSPDWSNIKEIWIHSTVENWSPITYIDYLALENIQKNLTVDEANKVYQEGSYLNINYSSNLGNEKLTTRPANVNITSFQVNPTEYSITAQASEAFYLIFSEAYHPEWNIKVGNGEAINNYPVYEFGNIFWVNSTGVFRMSLEFERQKLFNIGLTVSLITLAVLSLLIIRTLNSNFWSRRKNITSNKIRKTLTKMDKKTNTKIRNYFEQLGRNYT